MDDSVTFYAQSEKRKQETRIKMINSNGFKKEIMENPKVKHVILEVYQKHCMACMFSNKLTSVLSRKLEKHGYSNDLHMFRMDIDNNVPELGNIQASPTYLYIRKNEQG